MHDLKQQMMAELMGLFMLKLCSCGTDTPNICYLCVLSSDYSQIMRSARKSLLFLKILRQ